MCRPQEQFFIGHSVRIRVERLTHFCVSVEAIHQAVSYQITPSFFKLRALNIIYTQTQPARLHG